jgi:hypothetical protein
MQDSKTGAARRTSVICALAATPLLAVSAPALAQDVQPTIVGVWQITRHGVNCQTGAYLSAFPAVMQFDRSGNLGGYAVPPGATPSSSAPEFGVWERVPGTGNYRFRFVSMSYDPASGAVTGSFDVSAAVSLADQGNTLAYTATLRRFDAAGQLLFAGCGAASGTRLEIAP